MQAKDTIEGQRYIMPIRFGEKVLGIQSGWNYSKEYILFLLDNGPQRVMKTVLPNEEVKELGKNYTHSYFNRKIDSH